MWPFEPQLANRLLAALSATTQPFTAEARAFAIVTAPTCRAAVSRLIRTQISDVPVLSFLEIPPARAVDVLAVVGADDGNASHRALPTPNFHAGDQV
jgi:flagellar biosynthesis component FlhA